MSEAASACGTLADTIGSPAAVAAVASLSVGQVASASTLERGNRAVQVLEAIWFAL
jgi:hypothetical protein